MNTHWKLGRGLICLALGVALSTSAGCKHSPKRPSTPATETQAPVFKTAPAANSREVALQRQIESMQDQIRTLSAQTEARAAFHSLRMTPQWRERVDNARADASRPSERMRYLEAMKALLARRLEALRDELKIYQELEASDPSIPRP